MGFRSSGLLGLGVLGLGAYGLGYDVCDGCKVDLSCKTEEEQHEQFYRKMSILGNSAPLGIPTVSVIPIPRWICGGRVFSFPFAAASPASVHPVTNIPETLT